MAERKDTRIKINTQVVSNLNKLQIRDLISLVSLAPTRFDVTKEALLEMGKILNLWPTY